MVNNYFAGYVFSTPPAYAPFGNEGRNSFRAPGLWQWDLTTMHCSPKECQAKRPSLKACRLALPAGAVEKLDQGQGAAAGGFRHRRLYHLCRG